MPNKRLPGKHLNWLYLVAGLCFTALAPAAMAQPATTKILVLTSNEGAGSLSAAKNPSGSFVFNSPNTKLDGVQASDNLAQAFGWVPPGQTVSTLIPPATQPTQVDYLYGILSVRQPTTVEAVKFQDSTHLARVFDRASTTQGVEELPGTQASNPQQLLQKDSFIPPGGGRYDLIVVGTTYYPALDANYTLLSEVMKDPLLKPKAILYFVDSCCDGGQGMAPASAATQNMSRFITDILNPAISTTPAISTDFQPGYNSVNDLGLSTTSDYRASFTSLLPAMRGGYFLGLTNIPANNNLFPLAATTAYGAFFPPKDVFGGAGTCTFAVVDITPFSVGAVVKDPFDYNTGGPINQSKNNIGLAFIHAALDGGSCGGVASIAATPSTQTVSLASPTATITLTVTNKTLADPTLTAPGAGAVTGGRVEASLPAPLVLASPITSNCTGATITQPTAGGAFKVENFSVPFQQTCTITLPVRWTDSATVAQNACIKLAQQTSTLKILPGPSPLNFSTTEGQTVDVAQADVTCAAPELEITQSGFPTSTVPAGSTQQYNLTVTNLSETASAAAVLLSDFLPSGATLVSIQPVSGSTATCTGSGSCNLGTLAALGSATYAIQFKTSTTQTSFDTTPRVDIQGAAAGTEVSMNNNVLTLRGSSQLQPPVVNPNGGSGGASNVTAVPSLQTLALAALTLLLGALAATQLRGRHLPRAGH